MSGHFLRAPEPGPAEITVEVTRQGRRVSQARTTLWQNQRPCLDALVSAGSPPSESAEPDWSDLPAPDLTPPEQCPTGPPDQFEVELLNHLDLRVDPEDRTVSHA